MIREKVKKAVLDRKKIAPYKIPLKPPFKVGILGADVQDPNAFGEDRDFWKAVMKSLETIFHYEYVRQNPWPTMSRGPMLNKHQLAISKDKIEIKLT